MLGRFAPIAALLLLGGCWGPAPAPKPTPTPSPTPTPAVAFNGDQTFSCSDRLAQAEWIVCGNRMLMDLDHQLAVQWTNAARGASQSRLDVQEEDRFAFEDQRNDCRDVKCIAAVYRSELRGGGTILPPPPSDRPKPVVRTVVKKVYVKPRKPRHPMYNNRDTHPNDNRNSCALVIGLPRAERLAAACARGSGGRGQCSVLDSCEDLRAGRRS